MKNDFLLQNENGQGDKIDEATINTIKDIKGIKFKVTDERLLNKTKKSKQKNHFVSN